ncbi:potassium/sodium hyperpolarization-activated cyclic nucleotide-gated channel 2-like [Canis lupus dingo]|uniref:potassium/sodium hyperpolarization-activated cyclic nucleotide-gated channel 2-like n=1 Tax=Canis lupus dingo TaxID=286419 RepID=UPI000DC6AACE|nr:potassium/sodium hyperpolarization-activated cyclic nucleotide-gated channel 2-like [Canis lupus dingo]
MGERAVAAARASSAALATLRPHKQLPLLLLVSTFPRRPRALATLSGGNSPGTPSFCRPLPRHPAPYPPPRPGPRIPAQGPRRARGSARLPPDAPPDALPPRSLPVPAAPGRLRLRRPRLGAGAGSGGLGFPFGSGLTFCAPPHPPDPERGVGARRRVRLFGAAGRWGPQRGLPRSHTPRGFPIAQETERVSETQRSYGLAEFSGILLAGSFVRLVSPTFKWQGLGVGGTPGLPRPFPWPPSCRQLFCSSIIEELR